MPQWNIFVMTLDINSAMMSIGKESAEGIPPASEIIPGSPMTFKISRMALAAIACVRDARSCFIIPLLRGREEIT